ncbi:MAG TPA: DinB family protein [Pyrinomonadaceae bacterium]|nr:DinB family protein [Pyrinomonadaceae bacterium]
MSSKDLAYWAIMTQTPMAYQDFLRDFEETIRSASARLREIGDEESTKSTGDDWSAKQILGHLIDSAANNHQRFVRGQFTDTLEFPGYEQEQWVSAQKYNDESWPAVIELWRAYNMHLLHVVSVIPHEVLTQQRDKHSLEQIAFKTVERNQPATLEYLIRDYLDHLKHHLDQIWRRL